MKKFISVIMVALCIVFIEYAKTHSFFQIEVIKKPADIVQELENRSLLEEMLGIYYVTAVDINGIAKMKNKDALPPVICKKDFSNALTIVEFLMLAVLLYCILEFVKQLKTQEKEKINYKDYLACALIACYPYLYMYSINASEMSLPVVLYISLAVVSCALLVYLIFNLITKRPAKAILIALLPAIVFNFYHIYTIVLAIVLFAVILTYSGRKILDFLKIFTAALLALLVLNFTKSFDIKTVFPDLFIKDAKMDISSNKIADRDVFIILLDMYPANDTLQDQLNYDNSEFYKKLNKLGFYNFENIYSNYSKTTPTVISSLNFDYINNLDISSISNAILYSKFFRLAKKSGYKTGYFTEDDYIGTKSPYVDKICYDDKINLKDINSATTLLSGTLFGTFTDLKRYTRHAANWNLGLKPIIEKAGMDKPSDEARLYFVHLFAPHSPYRVDKNYVPLKNPYDIMISLSEFQINKASFLAYLEYTNMFILDTVEKIIKNSKKPPIIVLFGDHGIRPHYYLSLSENKKYYSEQLKENGFLSARFKILLSIYCPKEELENYKDTKTLINFFRKFSNARFGTNYKKIKDKAFYTHHGASIYNFNELLENSIDVTDMLFK